MLVDRALKVATMAVEETARVTCRGSSTSGRAADTTVCNAREEAGVNRRAWIEHRLARVPMFAGLSKPQLASIGRAATRLDEPAGKLVNEDGQLTIVLVGEVEVRVGNRIAARCGSGDYIAKGSLTDDHHIR